MTGALPEFVEPMLAKPGDPFDSERHLFELKWDGIRALAFLEEEGPRLRGRRKSDLAARYPEVLEGLRALPPGAALDGELVCLEGERPDFPAVLRREQARSPRTIEHLSRETPVTYVVFDVLYRGGTSLLKEPLSERRRHLEELLAEPPDPRLVLSQGVPGAGLAFFEEVKKLAFEGMVAKLLESRYEAGLRTGSWTKVKETHETVCAIVGFMPEGRDDLKSLIVASRVEGSLRCVGKVGSGMTREVRRTLRGLLEERVVDAPWLECPFPGTWVEAGLYCRVSYLEITKGGSLRAPVFVEMISGDD